MPDTMLLRFFQVGRNKLDWDVHTNNTSPSSIIHLISAKRAVISQHIYLNYTSPTQGTIHAGFHTVGRFAIYSPPHPFDSLWITLWKTCREKVKD